MSSRIDGMASRNVATGRSQTLGRLGLFLATAALVVAVAVAPAPAQSNVVNCYDAERDVVEVRRAGDCTGRAIDSDAAAEVRARRMNRFRRAFDQEPAFRLPRAHGTGFFVAADGLVVTNHHVVEKCRDGLTVATTTGEAAAASVVATEPANDLALLRADLVAPQIAEFRVPPGLAAGADLIVIGYGTHTLPPIKPQLTAGQFEDDLVRGTRFRMKAAVRPGNSGGPVLDRSGRVVGVVFAQLNTVKTFEHTGQMVRDVGFAIALPVVAAFLERQGVAYAIAPDGAASALDDGALFDAARSFIARVSCNA